VFHKISQRAGVLVCATTLSLGALLSGGGSAAQASPSPVSPASASALVAVGAGSPTVEKQRRALAGGPDLAAAAINCWVNVSLRRYGLNTWVSMENDFKDARQYELRARAAAVGPWELFSVCRDDASGATNFVSQKNNRYVAAEKDYQDSLKGMLRARTAAGSTGTWEIFYTDTNPGGACTQIRAQANGLFVAAEQDYSNNDKGMLRARTPASGIGTWETFCW